MRGDDPAGDHSCLTGQQRDDGVEHGKERDQRIGPPPPLITFTSGSSMAGAPAAATTSMTAAVHLACRCASQHLASVWVPVREPVDGTENSARVQVGAISSRPSLL